MSRTERKRTRRELELGIASIHRASGTLHSRKPRWCLSMKKGPGCRNPSPLPRSAPLKLRSLEELDAGTLPCGLQFMELLAQPRRGLFHLVLRFGHNLLGGDHDLLSGSDFLCLLHPLTYSFPTFSLAGWHFTHRY